MIVNEEGIEDLEECIKNPKKYLKAEVNNGV